MNMYRESGGTAPRILNLATRWRWVVNLPNGYQGLFPLG